MRRCPERRPVEVSSSTGAVPTLPIRRPRLSRYSGTFSLPAAFSQESGIAIDMRALARLLSTAMSMPPGRVRRPELAGCSIAAMSDQPVVLYEVAERIARITLNRPERGNGITRELIVELTECVVAPTSTRPCT